MSNITVLVVHFIPVKTNFIYLHSKFLSNFSGNSFDSVTCVEIKHKKNLYYGSCYSEPYNSNGENALNISCAYGNSLGIEEHETVIISLSRQLPSLKIVHVTPISSDDWGILENSAEIVQSTILNQIRVVCVHQKLVVWVSRTFSLTIHIDRLDVENNYGKLEQFTELIVSPTIKNCEICSSTNITASAISFPNSAPNIRNIPFLKYVFSLLNPSETLSTEIEHSSSKPAEYSYTGIFRCLSVNVLKSFESIQRFHHHHYPYNVYVSSEYFHASSSNVDDQTPILCRLTHLPFISSKQSEIEKSEKLDHRTPSIANGLCSREIYVYLFTIPEDHFSSNAETNIIVKYPTIFVSRTIERMLDSRNNSKVMLEIVEKSISTPTLTEINFSILNSQRIVDQTFSAEVKRHFYSYNRQNFFLLNNYSLFESIGDEYLYFSFNPADVPFVEMSYDDLEQCDFKFIDRKIAPEFNDHSEPKMSHQLLHLSCFQKIVDELKSNIFLELCDQRWQNEAKLLIKNSNHIVIEGDNGSGKSSVINLLTDQIRFGVPFCGIFVKKLDCKTLKGKMVQKLEKVFEKALDECVHFQPSVLIFDDLDVLFISTKQSNHHSEERSAASYTNRLSVMLGDLIRFYLPNRVTVLATATDVSSFEANLFQARGATIFSKKIRIPPLDRDMRRDALIELLKNKHDVIIPESMVNSYDFQDVIQQLEAFCIQDVNDLVNRIYFEMLKRRRVETQVRHVDSLVICQEDINRAISQIIPMSLKGVDFLKNSSTSWKDVGGLESAKQILTEILIWPSKHSKVFKQCPLKMQSAVLLYGAPGCGKTLLASAIAGESGLNFISIKGPELLSKFVGESEEGVRKTFQRAQNAKPCILFFDEFESLAPRRGNDITGVTDRVVNQLLTELDGVESISGVWILAATSKPDLIDPALLRPGRLGSLVYCPLPNQNDRLSILNVICESTHLADDVNLNTIAEITKGYTGADLRAVLFNAYMNCDKIGTEPRSPNENEYHIDMNCLVMAVKNTKPSLKLEERMQFEKLYRRFSQKDEKFDVGVEKQRLSYA